MTHPTPFCTDACPYCRIEELEAERDKLAKAIVRLRDATYTVPGMLCHKMVGESELNAVLELAPPQEGD